MYSFKDKRTYTYDEKPNIHFVQRINRNFPTRNEADIKHVMDKILKPIFDNTEQLEYVLHSLSRSMAGYVEDKKWFNWVGMRNCGKSVLTMFLSLSGFGVYSFLILFEGVIHFKEKSICSL